MRKAVFLLLLSAGICLPSCQPDTPSSPSFESSEIPSFPSSSEPEKYDYAQIEETTIRLRNSSLNATFQKNTGFLNSLSDKNGNLLKKQGIGSWPLEIVTDDGATAKIAQDGKNKVSSFHVEKGDHEETLRFQYEELLDETGRGLGIACETRFSLGETSFLSFSFSLTLSENAPSIDKVYCLGDGICAPDKDGWVLTAPIWNGGEQWSNPMENASFKKGVTLAYPGRSQATLEAGWFDLSSASGGLGIGLIDRKQMSNEFLLKANDASLSLRSALFEPTQLLGEDDDLSLKPGESFSSDSYFLAVHENDWHETADIYRKLYESSFAGEFLTKETLSSKAKNAPFVYRAIAGWNTGTVDEHELAYTTFEKMEKDLKTFKEGALREGDELDLEGMLFWLTGQNTQGYAFDVPMMTPILPQSGGETGLMALTQHLHEQGANIFQYEHPFAVDPDRLEEESPGLLAKVDPNQHT
ncbi:MAG: hypothetical protein J5736_02940, partial [Bacilli bacterium]|nr:hypothetical protein [Bacilli bacterium]